MLSKIQNPTAAAVEFLILVLNNKMVASEIQYSTAAAVDFWILVLNKKKVAGKTQTQKSDALAAVFRFWIYKLPRCL